ncbi:DUF2624 domain-containing protein [Bacillus tuaregi]|uniref:DUF2624 domain-containing protein n=1 Tax=Bacillus tuaregi TaxID=1816695 RepID=UPI0008F8BAA2|nr:DUF2624 domain-containing protein [Bacillus tuaregi]
MRIFASIINQKINSITAEELLRYAKIFKISITGAQAAQIAKYLRGRQVNIFDDRERAILVKEIARTAGVETAREVNRLFLELMK